MSDKPCPHFVMVDGVCLQCLAPELRSRIRELEALVGEKEKEIKAHELGLETLFNLNKQMESKIYEQEALVGELRTLNEDSRIIVADYVAFCYEQYGAGDPRYKKSMEIMDRIKALSRTPQDAGKRYRKREEELEAMVGELRNLLQQMQRQSVMNQVFVLIEKALSLTPHDAGERYKKMEEALIKVQEVLMKGSHELTPQIQSALEIIRDALK